MRLKPEVMAPGDSITSAKADPSGPTCGGKEFPFEKRTAQHAD